MTSLYNVVYLLSLGITFEISTKYTLKTSINLI